MPVSSLSRSETGSKGLNCKENPFFYSRKIEMPGGCFPIRETFIPAVIQTELCLACGRCLRACPNRAISFKGSVRSIDYTKCRGCLLCVSVCGQNAITVTNVYHEGVFGIAIDHGRCVGAECQACIEACPQHLYHLNSSSAANPEVKIHTDEARLAECRGCRACEEACPHQAIRLLEYRGKRENH